MFIGKHKGREVCWNACMTTARGDYFDHVSGVATDEGYDKYPSPDDYNPFKHEPCGWDEKGKPTQYRIIDQPEFKQLNTTRQKWIAERTIELLNSKTISIPRTQVVVDETYKWGVGLHIRCDQETINVDDVTSFIQDYTDPTGFHQHADSATGDVICYNAADLGVELAESGTFVAWKTLVLHDVVSLNIDKFSGV